MTRLARPRRLALPLLAAALLCGVGGCVDKAPEAPSDPVMTAPSPSAQAVSPPTATPTTSALPGMPVPLSSSTSSRA